MPRQRAVKPITASLCADRADRANGAERQNRAMHDFLQQAFVMEIRSQSEFGLTAIKSAMESIHQGDSRGFRDVQSFLMHAGTVSKCFWSPADKPESKARCKALRALFALDDTSPLKSRKLRDHLEHYDERLDTWYRNSTRHQLVHYVIGGPASFEGFPPQNIMRWFDPGTGVFVFCGTKFELMPLGKELERVYRKSEELLSTRFSHTSSTPNDAAHGEQ